MTNPTLSTPAYRVKAVTFTVPSSKGDGTVYTITCDTSDGRPLTCTCLDFAHRGHLRPCKHLKLVSQRDHGGYRPRVRIAVHTREAAAESSAAPAVAVASPARPRVPYEKVAELYA